MVRHSDRGERMVQPPHLRLRLRHFCRRMKRWWPRGKLGGTVRYRLQMQRLPPSAETKVGKRFSSQKSDCARPCKKSTSKGSECVLPIGKGRPAPMRRPHCKVASSDPAPTRTADAGIAASVRFESEPSSSVDDVAVARARSFGVVLGAAEVVGAGARPEAGVRLRPVQREAYGHGAGHPVATGRSGRRMWTVRPAPFRQGPESPGRKGWNTRCRLEPSGNPLPAALFAAFDPMWAKTSASGITQIHGGQFRCI